MATRFATLEARTRDAVIRHLANCTVTLVPLDGGASIVFDAIYDSDDILQGFPNPVESCAPQLRCASVSLPACTNRSTLTIDTRPGFEYTVRSHDPEGPGITVLRLFKSAISVVTSPMLDFSKSANSMYLGLV